MSENLTRDMSGGNGRSFEERVFARFNAMDARFNAMDARFNAMDARFEGLERRLTTLEVRVDSRFDGLERRLTTLEERVDSRLRETRPIWEAVQARLEDIHSQFQEVIRDLFPLRGRIARLEDRERPPAA